MEPVFDELKQYIIKEITDNVDLEGQKYPNLLEHKKYLIVYFDNKNPNQLKLIEYAGRFCVMTPCYPGAYGDLGEGIYFFGIYRENNIFCSSKSYVAHHITGKYNCYRTDNNFLHKFYELEDSFCKQNFLDIYSHVVTNNNLNGISNTIQINSTKISSCIYLISEVDQINFGSCKDYSIGYDECNDECNDDCNNDCNNDDNNN